MFLRMCNVCLPSLCLKNNIKAATLVIALLATSAFGQISPDFFGLHINNLTNPWPTTVGVQFKNYRTHDSSATLWSQLNPSPGVYYWNALNVALQKAEQNGSQVDFNFYFTPSWASSDRTGSCVMGNNGGCYPPNDLKADGTGTD